MKKIFVFVIALFLLGAGPASADPVLGRWDPPQAVAPAAPTIPVHFVVLPNGGLQVTSPTNPNVFTPGHYMLFLLRGDVPSEAKIVQFS